MPAGRNPTNRNLCSLHPESDRAVAEGATAVQGQHACGICMEELPGACFVWPGGCSHAYCQGCMRQLCSVHVAEGGLDNLRCPQPDCKQPFVRQVCNPCDLCYRRRQSGIGEALKEGGSLSISTPLTVVCCHHVTVGSRGPSNSDANGMAPLHCILRNNF